MLLYTSPRGPSIAVEVRAPAPRIVGAVSGEATSLAYACGGLLAGVRGPGCSRGVAVLQEARPLTPSFPVGSTAPSGGVPLEGYREAVATLYSDRDGYLVAYGYSLDHGPGEAEAVRYRISRGANLVDLSPLQGLVVSMRMERGEARVRLHLS